MYMTRKKNEIVVRIFTSDNQLFDIVFENVALAGNRHESCGSRMMRSKRSSRDWLTRYFRALFGVMDDPILDFLLSSVIYCHSVSSV